VERIEAHEKRVLLSLKSAAGNDAKDGLDPGVGSFHIQDGDRITISPILPYSNATVYLQGHVFRPGKYSYHPGMQIGEVLKSYQDLLPEPAERAEIVRLAPPDYRPTTIEFKLGEVVGGDDPIDLEPFDTIRVFGRYEADPPTAYIYGEVLRPGKYPLTEGMTAAGLVRMAGGFKRSALTEEADIASYVVRPGGQIVTKHVTVEIAKALAGNSAADATLKAEDILTVRQLTGWTDIGASIKLNGEVLYPGTYGIEDGEKLSVLLKRAGGFRRHAYPEGAVLERVQIREFEEKSRTQLMQRLEAQGSKAKFSVTSSPQEQTAILQNMEQQQQHVLTALRNQPASGRMVIKISSDIEQWQNTGSDIELRAGDVITIPKQPSFVLVTGQVYNSTALTYTPGKNAAWYLHQAGGPTELANKKQIYVIRANGSVVGRGSGGSWFSGDVLSTTIRRGDSIVVPEKVIGGTSVWKNLMDTAQLTSSLAIAARVATSF
jgi:protein involved in polysaccharide export with SLBB domain